MKGAFNFSDVSIAFMYIQFHETHSQFEIARRKERAQEEEGGEGGRGRRRRKGREGREDAAYVMQIRDSP